ncbi:unnamed protein product [Ranitomeya imitator]|uniref:Flavin-containing monooxygenase n=1 Tax=Ranitomeya imitator TaxID=111125 RepID=A0ABN9LE73_9NEOB|nr:unnamed protein product [Ranitomeya imitator]
MWQNLLRQMLFLMMKLWKKDIDVVIFATGYSFSFPFCEELKVQHNKVSLYKYTFPTGAREANAGRHWFDTTTWGHYAPFQNFSADLPQESLQSLTGVTFLVKGHCSCKMHLFRYEACAGRKLLGRRDEYRLQHPTQGTALNCSAVSCTVRVVLSRHTGGTRLPHVCHTDVLRKHTDTDNSGEQRLPPVCDMKEDIRKKREEMENRYVCSQRHTIQVDYLEFMDELAELLGVKPKMSLFLTDPQLAWNVYFGPCTPYQYRISGPGKWVKARATILSQWDRVLKPIKTRYVEPSSRFSLLHVIIGLVILAAIFFFL